MCVYVLYFDVVDTNDDSWISQQRYESEESEPNSESEDGSPSKSKGVNRSSKQSCINNDQASGKYDITNLIDNLQLQQVN